MAADRPAALSSIGALVGICLGEAPLRSSRAEPLGSAHGTRNRTLRHRQRGRRPPRGGRLAGRRVTRRSARPRSSRGSATASTSRSCSIAPRARTTRATPSSRRSRPTSASRRRPPRPSATPSPAERSGRVHERAHERARVLRREALLLYERLPGRVRDGMRDRGARTPQPSPRAERPATRVSRAAST